jgi:hypothetical protein
MPSKPGSIVHVEIHSPAPEKTQRFYESVFGWKFESVPAMNYTTFTAPSPPNGGIMSPMEGEGPTVMNYILSTEIDETIRKIELAGGAILVPKSEIPKMGWFAIFRDPAGVTQAVYQDVARPARPAAARARKAKRAAKKVKRGRRSGRKGRR